MTDICSGWTESIALLAKEQSLVVEAIEILRGRLPFPVLGIDTDDDSAFINSTLVRYCTDSGIEFTRARAYQSNDQAWIEQKNGSVVRRFVGYDRYSGIVAGQALARLYQTTRLYVNFFQPSFKLKEKVRVGANVRRSYHRPATPCDRLLSRQELAMPIKETLRSVREQLDPLALLHEIREVQAALATLASPEKRADAPGKENLAQFLAQLPRLWRSGDARPTHRKATKERNWRTRNDPFETVWPETLRSLQSEPGVTAKALFLRLQETHPGQFPAGQLRTLQRRVREWRKIMARELVFAGEMTNKEPQLVWVWLLFMRRFSTEYNGTAAAGLVVCGSPSIRSCRRSV